MNALLEDLLDYGFKVVLVQSRRNYQNPDLPHNLQQKIDLEVVSVVRGAVSKNSFVKRYIEEAMYHFKAFLVWRSIQAVDVVFVQSCPTVLFSILLLKVFTKTPVVYSIQDMWPGSAVNSGVIKNMLVANVFYVLQKLAYKYCDVVTVISEDMSKKVVEQGVDHKKIVLIPNWVDDLTVHEVPWAENRFVKKYGLSNEKFYVQYAGTMGYVFDYEMVLLVAGKLGGYAGIEFHMIGQGSQKDVFMREAIKRGLHNIKFFPIEPQHMVADVYSACSICFIPLKRGIIGNSVPSKAGLLMACRRAILSSVDENSQFYRMFNHYGIGVSVSNTDHDLVAKAVVELYKDSEKRNLLASKGHEFGKDYYGRRTNTKKFAAIFENIAREGSM